MEKKKIYNFQKVECRTCDWQPNSMTQITHKIRKHLENNRGHQIYRRIEKAWEYEKLDDNRDWIWDKQK